MDAELCGPGAGHDYAKASSAITFPAKIEVKHGIVNANGKVIIDRTKWDVRYNSGKFFDNLADETISDDIEFDMKIAAKK